MLTAMIELLGSKMEFGFTKVGVKTRTKTNIKLKKFGNLQNGTQIHENEFHREETTGQRYRCEAARRHAVQIPVPKTRARIADRGSRTNS